MTLYQSAQSTSLANNTDKIIDLTVPQGKIWIVHAIHMHNGDDVSRNMEAWIADSSNIVLHRLGIISGAPAGSHYEIFGYVPTSSQTHGTKQPIKIKGGNKLRLKWTAGGASSGGTAYYCITYDEVPE